MHDDVPQAADILKGATDRDQGQRPDRRYVTSNADHRHHHRVIDFHTRREVIAMAFQGPLRAPTFVYVESPPHAQWRTVAPTQGVRENI